jgi:hypothetical protein
MSRPGRYDLIVYRGDYHEWPLTLKVNTGNAENPVLQNINLTGHEFKAQIRPEPDGPVLASLDFITDDIADGHVVAYLTSAKADPLPQGNLVWDVQSTYEGRVKTWVAGDVTVTADVTRENGG